MRLLVVHIIFAFILIPSSLSAQFNTLNYVQPQEDKLIIHQDLYKETVRDSSAQRRRFRLFKPSKKALLQKENDSLKIILQQYQNVKNQKLKEWKDSMIQWIGSREMEKLHSDIKPNFSSKQKIAMPIKGELRVTSAFGMRKHPISGILKMHLGTDFACAYEPIYAVIKGVVSEVGWDANGGGNYIKINHFNAFETAYLHLSHTYYQVGETVEAGYIIGMSGNSGNSTAPHLHFSVKRNGKFINPQQFLNDLIQANNLIAIHYEQGTPHR